MQIDLTQANPTIDASDLARLLDLAPDEVMKLMREGAITSRFETGVDDDAGTYRLTFWYRDRKLRLTCDAAGVVVKTLRTSARRQT